MRYRITLSYAGEPFCGWQIQENAVTVQGEVEKALSIILKEDIHIVGAGRTDTGVNALRYTAHFDCNRIIANERNETCDRETISKEYLAYKLNAILKKGILIHDISECDENFHARFDAKSRKYIYFVHTGKDPFIEERSYRFPYELDVDKMNEAAAILLGRHDFSAFEKTGGDNTTSECTVFSAGWSSYTPHYLSACGLDGEGQYLIFTVCANRFLRNMVRAMVGTLLEIGRGKRDPQWIAQVLQSRNRCSAGQSVPGKALFFCGAEY